MVARILTTHEFDTWSHSLANCGRIPRYLYNAYRINIFYHRQCFHVIPWNGLAELIPRTYLCVRSDIRTCAVDEWMNACMSLISCRLYFYLRRAYEEVKLHVWDTLDWGSRQRRTYKHRISNIKTNSNNTISTPMGQFQTHQHFLINAL